VAYKETDIDFSEYFDDVIGVSIPQGKEPEHVLLRFASSRLPYVLSKPLHPSQKTKDKQQGLIEISVIPNLELEAQILWFGEDVEVLAPDALRQQIQEKIEKKSSHTRALSAEIIRRKEEKI
jgi:predicted DNA-binding transcriptional regulator YafY